MPIRLSRDEIQRSHLQYNVSDTIGWDEISQRFRYLIDNVSDTIVEQREGRPFGHVHQ